MMNEINGKQTIYRNCMKRFISTKFFLSLQEASQKGIDMDAQVLANRYDRFVLLLFSESAASTDRVAYRNMLVYTRVELASLRGVSEKKCVRLSEKIHRTC
jgi:hypothetical protein